MNNPIQIKNRFTGEVIYQGSQTKNCLGDVVEEAVAKGVSLTHADLSKADLYRKNLVGANFRDADLSFANLMNSNLAEANLLDCYMEKADLSSAILIKATLSSADARNANFNSAYLQDACLDYIRADHATFSHADLSKAIFEHATLAHTIFTGARMIKTSFAEASMWGARLGGVTAVASCFRYADLRFALLEHSNFSATNFKFVNFENAIIRNSSFNKADMGPVEGGEKHLLESIPMACPTHGAFIGWKKVISPVGDACLIKLEIPASAKRSSATSLKCRCSKAKVLEITKLNGFDKLTKVINHNYVRCVYEVGQMVYPNSFDEDRFNECSCGIHFFTDKQRAIEY